MDRHDADQGAGGVARVHAHGVGSEGHAYVTLHRPSNVDDPERLSGVVSFLERVAGRVPLVFPVHPRTRARLEAAGLDGRLDAHPGIRRCTPLSYRESLGLMARARVVITDSGGVQEETTFLGVPCITLRPNTERPVTERLGKRERTAARPWRSWP